MVTYRPEPDAESRKPLGEATICAFQYARGHGDAEIARLASIQHGHVHRAQLEAAGLGRGALSRRLATGRLYPTFPSVYSVGRPAHDHLGRAMAAALHYRGSALVSALDAAERWHLPDSTMNRADTEPIDVLLVARGSHEVRGVRLHRVKALARQDARWRHGIPVTSPARTLLDLAAVIDELELEAVLSVALGRRVLRPAQLADVIARNPHAKGVARLRTLLDDAHVPRDTRSGYERRLLALIRDADLPRPVTNVRVGKYLVEMLWPDLKLVVEFDSWRHHGSRASFEGDRLRDQVLAATGHDVMRITTRQVDNTPTAVISRLATTIAIRRLGQ